MRVNNLKTLSTDIKTSNASLVLRLVRENAPVSRADIARMTGLTRATVSALIGSLLEMGYLEEIGFNTPGSVGKRATMLEIKTDKIFALSIKFSYHSIYMAKVDLRGDLHDQVKQALIKDSKDSAIKTLFKLAHAFIDRAAEQGEKITGIGIAVPSPMKDGVMAYSSSFHCLEGVDLKEILTRELKMAVYVNNDADAAALAEVWYGDYPQGTNLAFVLLHQGIGCGVMRDKELYVRAMQTSNEFGHIRIESGGPVCFCGKVGCLVAFASDWAIHQRLSAKMRDKIEKEVKDDRLSNIEKMMTHMKNHEPSYLEYTKQAAKYLGIGISNLVVMFMPDVIVLEGDMLDVPGFINEVEASCEDNVHPMFNGTYKIGRSQLKKDASLIGAGTFLVRDMYANPFKDWKVVG